MRGELSRRYGRAVSPPWSIFSAPPRAFSTRCFFLDERPDGRAQERGQGNHAGRPPGGCRRGQRIPASLRLPHSDVLCGCQPPRAGCHRLRRGSSERSGDRASPQGPCVRVGRRGRSRRSTVDVHRERRARDARDLRLEIADRLALTNEPRGRCLADYRRRESSDRYLSLPWPARPGGRRRAGT